METRVWHFSVWSSWSNKIYGNTLNQDNFFDDGRIHHQDKMYKIIGGQTTESYDLNEEDTYFIKIVQGSTFYLLPKRYIKELPIEPIATQLLHLKKSDTQVWKFITNVNSLTIPQKRTMGFREFVLRFNPMEHSDLMSWTILKLIALSKGVKLGVCGPVGNGKNCNLTLIRQIRKNVAPKVKHPTLAKFYFTLKVNDYINIDEITSWANAQSHLIEDLAAELGDESPDLDKFSKDKNRNMEMIGDLNTKSLTFTFNNLSKDNPHTFESKFKNPGKMLDRFPMLLLEGQVQTSIKRPNSVKAKALCEENFKEMCEIVANDSYYLNNLHKHMNNWCRDKCGFKRRHLSNISGLLDVLDAYCVTQQEFDDYLQFLNVAHHKFLAMGTDVMEGVLVKEEEVN